MMTTFTPLPPRPQTALLHEAVVVPHQQVRLDLLQRVQRDADDDQQAGAAEEERHVQQR